MEKEKLDATLVDLHARVLELGEMIKPKIKQIVSAQFFEAKDWVEQSSVQFLKDYFKRKQKRGFRPRKKKKIVEVETDETKVIENRITNHLIP